MRARVSVRRSGSSSVRPAAFAVATLLAVSVLAGCSGVEGETTATDVASTPTGQPCEYVESEASPAKPVDPPPGTPSRAGAVDFTLETSAGTIGGILDARAAPCTVGSFASLAEQGYFDQTTCHRLTTGGIFVLQCGDPTGTGTGGPGYTFADELDGKETYPAGTIAMANAGPGTNGSQFFLVYADTPLPPQYTVFGEMDDAGVAVVEEVAAAGTADGEPDGPPRTPVEISSVTVGE